MKEIVPTVSVNRKVQAWFTAQEIADAAKRLEVKSVPTSKRRILDLAQREEWGATTLARKRQGSLGGGGTEYHISLLPDALKFKIMGEQQRALATDTKEQKELEEKKRRNALSTTSMSARQRHVMDARAAILNVIDKLVINDGSTRRAAILEFMDDPHGQGISDDALITANDRAKAVAKISRSTLYDWFKKRDESGVAALAPLGTKEQSEIPEWFWKLFMTYYAKPHKPTLKKALKKYIESLPRGRNTPPPNYDQCRRYLARLGNVEKHRGREGSYTLMARLSYVTRTTDDLLPTYVYTADGKTFDAEVQHPFHGRPFKPEITTIEDVATRFIVGFSIGLSENAWDVADALRNAIEQYGIPAIFYADNGSGFKNKMLDRSCIGLMDRLGITKKHSLARRSQSRGLIERVQKTLWNDYAKEFDTYMGDDMDRQRQQYVYKVTRKDLKEFGTSSKLPTWQDFLDGAKEVIEKYNNSVHSTLKMSPADAWQKHVDNGFEPFMLLDGEADGLFRPYIKRRVRRCLIAFNTNNYFSEELTEFNGDDVFVKYDIHDPKTVWVWTIEETEYGLEPGRFIASAIFAGNEQSYFAKSVVDGALEKRTKGRKKRVEARLAEIDDEINSQRFLDHQPMEAMDVISPIIEGKVISQEEVISTSDHQQKPQQKKHEIRSDADLARFAIQQPKELSAMQRDVLRECLMSKTDRENLEMSGIDLDALKAVIRAAA